MSDEGRKRYPSDLTDQQWELIELLLPRFQTGFNRYPRYVLPAFPFLFIFISSAGRIFELKKTIATSAIVCLLASIINRLWGFLHSMSYFNLAAGGPADGPRYLLDANID